MKNTAAEPQQIAACLARVRERIAAAARRAGRREETITLIAVSKTHPAALLLDAARAGQAVFGENRVQEFATKREALEQEGFAVRPGDTASAPPQALEIHLIGQLQSNKAARAAELFSAVDTLDSVRLAERLDRAARELGRVLPVLLEIKLSHEATKTGMAPGSPELETLLERLPDMAALRLRGLMTVAPLSGDPAVARDTFRALRQLRDQLAPRHPRLGLETLSMGMSSDMEAAIEEGSTEVRVGTAIFGARPPREHQL